MLKTIRTLAATALWCAATAAPTAAPATPRVIVYILGDDVGYGDVGFNEGSPAKTAGPNGTSLTPRLDALAASEGLVLSRHMSHFMCTPSRTSLLSGRLPVHVQQGQDTPETPHAGMPRDMTSFANKLQEAGWVAHAVGKWDLGIATPAHTPAGRGFNTSLVFAEHMVDSWSQQVYPGGTTCQLLDPHLVDLWDGDGPARTLNGTGFIEDLFQARVQEILTSAADPTAPGNPPLLLYYAPKATHYPLMVPQSLFDAFDYVTDDTDACNATVPYIWPGRTSGLSCRRQAMALMSHLDSAVGAVVDLLQARGWWNDTLLVFSSDNGAALDPQEAGGTSWPLRGGKYANFLGGILTPALVAGGVVPPALRGSSLPVLTHIADFYATFCEIAGVDPTDHKAAAAGLPPIDSLSLWPLISGQNSSSPRSEVPVSPGSLISWPYQLVTGWNWWSGYSGPQYPNASSTDADKSPDIWVNCGDGCLWDISSDVTQSNDLAPAMPAVVAAMSQRLAQLAAGFWTNNDTGVNACPSNVTVLCGCWAAQNTWGGYLGPYQL